MREGPVAPLPTLAQAPSPSAGNQSASASAGQRLTKSARKRPGGPRLTRGERQSATIPDTSSISESHSIACTSRSPVPDAMQMVAAPASSPQRRPRAYTAKESQRVVRRKASGSIRLSQHSLAGQYDE